MSEVHPTPGQPLTAESVGLLKAGDVLRHKRLGLTKVRATYPPDTVSFHCLEGPNTGGGDGAEQFTFIERPTSPPIEDAERGALEAVMRSVDPATWSGLTANERAALGRFAKPANQSRTDPVSDVEVRISDLIRAKYNAVKATIYHPGTPSEALKDGILQGLNTAVAIAMVAEEEALIARSQPKGAGQSSGEARDRLEALAADFDTLSVSTKYDAKDRELWADARADILSIRALIAPTDNADGLSADRAAPAGQDLAAEVERLRAEIDLRDNPPSGWTIIESDGTYCTLRDDETDREFVINANDLAEAALKDRA